MSFDGLEDNEKAIFLNVACFFKAQDKDYVVQLLDNCNFYAKDGIGVLINKSLITIESSVLWMHDLLQEMGWEMVRQDSFKEPGKRSRLWFHAEVLQVLQENSVSLTFV